MCEALDLMPALQTNKEARKEKKNIWEGKRTNALLSGIQMIFIWRNILFYLINNLKFYTIRIWRGESVIIEDQFNKGRFHRIT